MTRRCQIGKAGRLGFAGFSFLIWSLPQFPTKGSSFHVNFLALGVVEGARLDPEHRNGTEPNLKADRPFAELGYLPRDAVVSWNVC